MALLLGPALPGAAQSPGDLDAGFGSGGRVTTDWGRNGTDAGLDVALQSDGKIVIGGAAEVSNGNSDFGVVRYNADGTLDTSFGTDGKVSTNVGSINDHVTGVAIQPDGKIVAVGNNDADFVVVRYTASGALDTTFGDKGIVITDFVGQIDKPYDVVIDGSKIVVVGLAVPNATSGDDFAAARYNPDGTLDATFGTAGKAMFNFGGIADTSYAMAVARQTDGKLVLAGTADGDFALARLLANGTLDSTFGGDGKVTTEVQSGGSAQSLAIQPDGKLVAAGGCGGDFCAVRYQANGALDNSFGAAGKVTTDFNGKYDFAKDVVVDAENKIILAGQASIVSNDFALVRYTSTGALDNSFGAGGKMTTDWAARGDGIFGLKLDAEGKLVAAGYSYGASSDIAVARYHSKEALAGDYALYLPLVLNVYTP